MMVWILLAVLTVYSGSLVRGQGTNARAQTFIRQGDQEMLQRKWHDAAVAFQSAVDADSDSAEAHGKLSNALAFELKPGLVTSPENSAQLIRILNEQQRAADLAPGNAAVVSRLARIQYAVFRASTDPAEQEKNRDLATKNLGRALVLNPKAGSLHFQVGNMGLFGVIRDLAEARRNTPYPTVATRVPDEASRRNLMLWYGLAMGDAITHLEKAVELQPNNGFAMLLIMAAYQVRASFSSTDESVRDSELAKHWGQRAITRRGASFRPEEVRNLLQALLSPQVSIADDPGMAPPPPPPPIPLLAISPVVTCGAPPNDRPVRVSGSVAEMNLVKKVGPEYPAAAKAAPVCGTIRFTAIIDKTGHVRQLDLISGHPLLVKAARDAVLQWEYKPTVFCGQVAEAVTEII
jgi:tetratricopeptide (TPR) repeat protein